MRWGIFSGSWVFPAMFLACVFGFLLALASTVRAELSRRKDVRRFGDEKLVGALSTYDAGARRTTKAVFSLLAFAAALLALARPQLGSGTRLVPATNLDVVLVLDYSKSMYARDVAPNRIARAKAEIARLIRELSGARFAAVAFAGEPMSFPLTSDGAAIAQFFRQLEPNDMPVGGTAIARALEKARELFQRDPKAKSHERVIVLVTDGEDLEGDPVAVAQKCAEEGTRVDVVQIGGRIPEVLPEVGPDGKVVGLRKDENGKPVTTELTAEGEKQLARIAELAHGTIVRAEKGEVGIEKITRGLSKLMREELAEKVETVYADAFAWPLGLSILLLCIEGLLGEAPRRARNANRKEAT